MSDDVRCGNCGAKLGERVGKGVVEVRHDKRLIRVEAGVIECRMCHRKVRIQGAPTTSVSTRGVFRAGQTD